MPRDLPARPSLEHLRKQAKELLRDARRGDPSSIERLRAAGLPAPPAATLTDAQRAVAREYGFTSWARLRAHVESLLARRDPVRAFAAAIRADDPARAGELLGRFPALRHHLDEPLPDAPFGATPLLEAVYRASRPLIDLLLDAGADIDARSRWWAGGFGVLDAAAFPRAASWVAEHLIARGATVTVHAAAALGMADRLAALLAADASAVHARGGDGKTPLHEARTVGIAELLLDHGAHIDAVDVDHESTAAQYAVRDRPEVARLLVSRGARSDLLMASALGDSALVRDLLDRDPAAIRTAVTDEYFPMQDPRAGGHIYVYVLGPNRTPHQVAREHGHEDVLALLMERSPLELRLTQAGVLGDEALFTALLAERPGLVRALASHDRGALVSAAQANDLRALRLMLGAGWPVDARAAQGATALHWASWHGNVAMVRDLLDRHAPANVRDDEFRATPLGWALHGSRNSWHRDRGDYAGTVEALLAAGGEVPPLDDDADVDDSLRALLARPRAGG